MTGVTQVDRGEGASRAGASVRRVHDDKEKREEEKMKKEWKRLSASLELLLEAGRRVPA